MHVEADDLDYLEDDQRVFNEKLERDGGVFIEPQRTQVDCNSDPGDCAPDDYPTDPYAIDNRPGTPDDVGYSYGIAGLDAADHHVIAEGISRTGRAASEVDPMAETEVRDEEELWHRMERRIDEDEGAGLRLPEGMDATSAERVLDAMSEDSEDAFDTSATGEGGSGLEHGGFPAREE